jgi:uncharacterized OB-fold protein
MPVQYLYTAGVAGERFFQTLKTRGVFCATTCPQCRITYLPPRLYCEHCFADLSDTWSEVAPQGRVHSYTIVHQGQDGQPLKVPQIIAFVRIDGSDGGLTGRLLHIQSQDVRLEMLVDATLLPPRQRRGRLDDIVGFTPRPAAPQRRSKR